MSATKCPPEECLELPHHPDSPNFWSWLSGAPPPSFLGSTAPKQAQPPLSSPFLTAAAKNGRQSALKNQSLEKLQKFKRSKVQTSPCTNFCAGTFCATSVTSILTTKCSPVLSVPFIRQSMPLYSSNVRPKLQHLPPCQYTRYTRTLKFGLYSENTISSNNIQ